MPVNIPSLIFDNDVIIQEENRDMRFWDDIKNFTKPYAVDDDYDDFDEEMDEAFAEEEPAPRFASRREAPAAAAEENNILGDKAFAAALTVGIAAAFGAIGMALAISKSVESR